MEREAFIFKFDLDIRDESSVLVDDGVAVIGDSSLELGEDEAKNIV